MPPKFYCATQVDVPTITAITNAAYEGYIDLIGRKPQPMTTDYDQMVAEHAIWILQVEDEKAGLIVLMQEPDCLLIYSVAIAPNFQGRGYGRQLLEWAETQARELGYDRIRLYTNSLMADNIARYTHLGYVETHREDFPGTTLVHMAKGL